VVVQWRGADYSDIAEELENILVGFEEFLPAVMVYSAVYVMPQREFYLYNLYKAVSSVC